MHKSTHIFRRRKSGTCFAFIQIHQFRKQKKFRFYLLTFVRLCLRKIECSLVILSCLMTSKMSFSWSPYLSFSFSLPFFSPSFCLFSSSLYSSFSAHSLDPLLLQYTFCQHHKILFFFLIYLDFMFCLICQFLQLGSMHVKFVIAVSY